MFTLCPTGMPLHACVVVLPYIKSMPGKQSFTMYAKYNIYAVPSTVSISIKSSAFIEYSQDSLALHMVGWSKADCVSKPDLPLLFKIGRITQTNISVVV